MPPRADAKLNLNTLLLVLSIIGGLATTMKFILPLATLPEKVQAVDSSVKSVRSDVDDVSRVQAVQTDVMRRMAEAVEKQESTRRDVDATKVEVQEIKRRLDRLESR